MIDGLKNQGENLNAATDPQGRLDALVMPINVIFDGPPGPEAGRFVEVETDDGESICVGEWIERPDGYWALRITELPEA